MTSALLEQMGLSNWRRGCRIRNALSFKYAGLYRRGTSL